VSLYTDAVRGRAELPAARWLSLTLTGCAAADRLNGPDDLRALVTATARRAADGRIRTAIDVDGESVHASAVFDGGTLIVVTYPAERAAVIDLMLRSSGLSLPAVTAPLVAALQPAAVERLLLPVSRGTLPAAAAEPVEAERFTGADANNASRASYVGRLFEQCFEPRELPVSIEPSCEIPSKRLTSPPAGDRPLLAPAPAAIDVDAQLELHDGGSGTLAAPEDRPAAIADRVDRETGPADRRARTAQNGPDAICPGAGCGLCVHGLHEPPAVRFGDVLRPAGCRNGNGCSETVCRCWRCGYCNGNGCGSCDYSGRAIEQREGEGL
jgi:hypothetical protein